MSDMVPQGWEVKKIGESKVVVLDGDRGSEYPKERDFSQNGYCLFLSAKNVTQNGFVFSDCSFISREKDEKLRKGRLDKFDIVITTRGTVGNIAFFDDSVSYEKIRINSGMAILRNEEKSISHIFLYHLLNSILIKNQIDFFTFGSAQPQLTIGTLNSIYLRIPPLAEQKKIASILTSVDQVIEKTESEISKLQDLKKGMMQQLLTQGIGHTQFKDSPVGRIPVGWEVKTLQNIIKKIIDNRGKTPPLSDTGYELLEVASITDNSRFPDFSTVRKFVDRNTYETWFRNGHPLIGDILVPTVGSIGQFAITRENRGCIAQNLVALRVNKFTDSTYTYYLLNGDVVESRISSILMGAVQPSLRVPHFMGISIPIPSLVEQQKIADILTSIDDSIQQQQRELQQTQNLKKSLMQDLLTGKVRVKVG